MGEQYFHFSPINRDVLDIVWQAMWEQANVGDMVGWDRSRLTIEQYVAKVVREWARRGDWQGNVPKPGTTG